MRYDWNRTGSPRAALVNRVLMWWVTGIAVLGCPLFLWEAVTADWTLVLPVLVFGGGIVALHAGWRKVYGVRETRPAAASKTHAETVAEAVEAIRQRQWDAIADRVFLASGGTRAGSLRDARGELRAALETERAAAAKGLAAASAARRAIQEAGRPRRDLAGAPPEAPAVKLDPRWEWKLMQAVGVPDRYVKVRCLHTEVEPVESLAGEVVAQLCLTCDTQFPAPRES